jgi:hypothetical protein
LEKKYLLAGVITAFPIPPARRMRISGILKGCFAKHPLSRRRHAHFLPISVLKCISFHEMGFAAA